MKTNPKREKKKRAYITDPKQKLKDGKPWVLHFEVDPVVAGELIAEKENSTTGAEYNKIINARLAKAYGIKPAKRQKAA